MNFLAEATLVILLIFVSSEDVETPSEIHPPCNPQKNPSQITSLYFFDGVFKQQNEISRRHRKRENDERPMDCADLKKSRTKSGVHKIWPRNRIFEHSVDVLCDMDDDGGGWTVIQRRGDFNSSQDYFYRDWNSYKVGFGSLRKDFWIGNDVIFALTNQRACSIKFFLTDWEYNATYATYDNFWIDDAYHNFTLHVDGYRGTAGDSFSQHNGHPFSAKDKQPNDRNCAVEYKGAWWYDNCHFSNLNGLYLRGAHLSNSDGVNWKTFRGFNYSLKDTYLKIRPRNME